MAISDRIAVMNVGTVEQVGKPLELYYRPRTEFVARFLGTGNILELEAENGVARLGNLELRVGVDGKVRVFFRPESVIITKGSNAEVVDYELLPGRMRLYLDVEGRLIIAERPLPDLPFEANHVPSRVGIVIRSFSLLDL